MPQVTKLEKVAYKTALFQRTEICLWHQLPVLCELDTEVPPLTNKSLWKYCIQRLNLFYLLDNTF